MDSKKFKNLTKEEFNDITKKIIDYINDYIMESTRLDNEEYPCFDEILWERLDRPCIDLTDDQLLIICQLNSNFMEINTNQKDKLSIYSSEKGHYKVKIREDSVPDFLKSPEIKLGTDTDVSEKINDDLLSGEMFKN